jgi:hypothetical protein
MGGESKRCEFIAQLSSNTINSGFLMFRTTPTGDGILNDWFTTHTQNIARGIV